MIEKDIASKEYMRMLCNYRDGLVSERNQERATLDSALNWTLGFFGVLMTVVLSGTAPGIIIVLFSPSFLVILLRESRRYVYFNCLSKKIGEIDSVLTGFFLRGSVDRTEVAEIIRDQSTKGDLPFSRVIAYRFMRTYLWLYITMVLTFLAVSVGEMNTELRIGFTLLTIFTIMMMYLTRGVSMNPRTNIHSMNHIKEG
ncbi:MAG: DUF2270 domain-containing protein [Pseudomonadota bacterium]